MTYTVGENTNSRAGRAAKACNKRLGDAATERSQHTAIERSIPHRETPLLFVSR